MKARFPKDTPLSDSPRVLAILEQLSSEHDVDDFWITHSAFSAAAGAASDSEDFELARVLWLISDIASFGFKPESLNEPFGPFMVTELGRSATVSDLKAEEVDFLSSNIDRLRSSRLRARILDVLWLVQRPRRVEHAIRAILEYSTATISLDTWHRGSGASIERAIHLGLRLNRPSESGFADLEDRVLTRILTATSADGYLALWITNLILKYGLADDKTDQIAARVLSVGEELSAAGNYHQARDYFLLGAKCYAKKRLFDLANRAIVRCVDEWEKEIDSVDGNGSQPAMRLAWLCESAIRLIRTVPRDLRTPLGLDSRLDALRSRMNEANQSVVRNMVGIETPPIDISDAVAHARTTVGGKSTVDALRELLNIFHGAKESTIRTQATASLERHSIHQLFTTVQYSHDGRVIRRVPGANFRGAQEPEVLWSQMMRDYVMQVGFYVQALIWPALGTFQLEHRLTVLDFVTICKSSPIVPPGREEVFGRAIYSGYDSDFLVASHLIAPQLENLVRYHLKMNGVKTTTFDVSGIETENGLSTLVDSPEMHEIFGDDLTFEIKALFCDSLGPNLRNEIAHGLLSDGHFITANTIYAWWFVTRLVFNSYLHAIATNTESND